MDGVDALSRSSADTTSLATAPRSLTYGVEDDNSSHHAAGAVNKTRATAPTATSKFRVTRRRFDAAARLGGSSGTRISGQHREVIGGCRYPIGNRRPAGPGRGERVRKVFLVRTAPDVVERESCS